MKPSAEAVFVSSASELLDAARHCHRERELPNPAVRAEELEEEQQRAVERDLLRLLVDEMQALGPTVEDDAEVGTERSHEPLRLLDELREVRPTLVALGDERVRRDRLDPERPEDERQHERRCGVAVVDDDPEVPRADRLHVERVE